MIIRGGILLDDDEDEAIPPEILDLMRITEAMSMGGGMFGGALDMPHIRKIPIEKLGTPMKAEERHDESHEEIMQKMESLHQEMGERQKRTKKSSQQGLRFY